MYCKINKIYCGMAHENGYCKLSACANPKFNANIHPTDMIHSVDERSKAVHFKESRWQTGTPTEEGDYLVAYKWGLDMSNTIHYEVSFFSQGHWGNIACKVLAWKKIEPYKETTE